MKRISLDSRALLAAVLLFLAMTAGPAAGDDAFDPFPNACVDCHLNFPERGLDVRLSRILGSWQEESAPNARRAAQAVASPEVRLEGKHPDVTGLLDSIPEACITCHGQNEEMAPPFAKLIHVLHLTGGEENHYIAEFHGDCRNCHKLDAGKLVVPSAAERQSR